LPPYTDLERGAQSVKKMVIENGTIFNEVANADVDLLIHSFQALTLKERKAEHEVRGKEVDDDSSYYTAAGSISGGSKDDQFEEIQEEADRDGDGDAYCVEAGYLADEEKQQQVPKSMSGVIRKVELNKSASRLKGMRLRLCMEVEIKFKVTVR